MANNEEKKKLTYEELEAYAQQTTARAKQIYDENMKLKQAMQDLRAQMNYSDINLAFKVLDHADKFRPEFVQKVTDRLEHVLTPQDPEPKEESAEKIIRESGCTVVELDAETKAKYEAKMAPLYEEYGADSTDIIDAIKAVGEGF